MAATNNYFRCRLIFSSVIFQNIVKNAHVQFPRAETDVFRLLVLFDQTSKTQTLFNKGT